MSDVSVKIEGIDRLLNKLGKVEGTKHLRAPMQRAVYRLQARMAQYPAKRAGSKYNRTYTLGKKWTSRIEQGNGSITGKVGNNTEYAPLVQSYRLQAGIHRGLWQTDKYVVDTERSTIVRDFEQAINEALR